MISVGELKELIYRETGYKLQVHDNDPILSTFYINLATLGEALKHAEDIQTAARGVIDSLPGAADREMQRAGNAAVRSLSAEVGRIAQELAGNAAAIEKAKAVSLATKWVTAGVIACSVVFFGLGFGVRMLADEINLKAARDKVADAYARADAAQAKAEADIAALRQSIGWLGSKEGQLAKSFFDSGAGAIAATCNSPDWDVVEGADGRYCVPKRRDLIGGDKEKHGWKIP